MPVLLTINVVYFCLIVLFGIYGIFYADFAPKERTEIFAKYLSILFFVYFTAVSVIFLMRNKKKLGAVFKSNARFYSYTILAVPTLCALISTFHFGALEKGIPSIFTEYISEKIYTEATITGKRLWGKRNRHEEVFISGFAGGFPVSWQYYNSVSVGQVVKLEIRESVFGTKIKFIRP
jgi:hypothetical protein